MPRPRSANAKPGLVPGFFLPVLLIACSEGGTETAPAGEPARLSVAGTLENDAVREASGIARSRRNPALLWLHNDSGSKARLYAIDQTGAHRGRLRVEEADNRDWEDLAAFTLDGTPYLLVADIGDNESERNHLTLYVVDEPDLSNDDRQKQPPAWRIRFRYPDGPRDAEAVAVDAASGQVLILTKRDLPPVLYSVPLVADGTPGEDAIVVARRLGEVTSLPRPSRRDLEFALATKDWHWQPTAMDIAPDGSAIAVMTYSAVYFFEHAGDWLATLNQPAMRLDLRGLRDAEAITFGNDAATLFVTVEKKHAPLVRIDKSPPPASIE